MEQMQMQLYDDVEMTSRKYVEMACSWIKSDYPRKWMRLVGLCESLMAQGMPTIRRGDLYVLAQQCDMPITECREFRFDNNLWAPLSRYLLMFRPELAKVIHPNKADLDRAGIDFERMWHEHVSPVTFFPARTWQEAVGQ